MIESDGILDPSCYSRESYSTNNNGGILGSLTKLEETVVIPTRPSDREYRILILGAFGSLVISSIVFFPSLVRYAEISMPSDIGQGLDSELRINILHVGTAAGLGIMVFLNFIVILSMLRTTKNWGQHNPIYGSLAQTLLWTIGLSFIVPRLIHLLSPVSSWLVNYLWIIFAVSLAVGVVKRHRTDSWWHILIPIIAEAVISILFFSQIPFVENVNLS